jgi:hypothetical protein
LHVLVWLQVQAFKLDTLAGFGAAAKAPLSLPRGDQERLLRRLELLRLVRQETARQETFQSITSVIQIDQVGVLAVFGAASTLELVHACSAAMHHMLTVTISCSE